MNIMQESIIDFKEAYIHYTKCKNINETQKVFRKRKESLIKNWKENNYQYPLPKTYKQGYELDHKPKKYKDLDIHYFKNIDTQEKAYFLGLIAADGCVYVKKNIKKGNRYSLSISLKEEDKYILDLFNHELNYKKKLQFLPPKKVSVNNSKIYTSSPGYRINIENKTIVKDLLELGINNKKSVLGFNFEKLILKENLIPHFIRGYFDGDGSVNIYIKNNSKFTNIITYICSNTIPILEYIKNKIPAEIDCYIKTTTYNNSKMNYLMIRANSAIKFYEYLYSNNPKYFLKRKFNNFNIYRTYVERSTLANSVNSEKGEIPNSEPSTIEIL